MELEDGCIGAVRVQYQGLVRWFKGDMERDWEEYRRMIGKRNSWCE